MKQIAKTDLVEMLRGLLVATPATIVAITEPKMNKKDNPFFGRVKKLQVSNVFINFSYEKSVNRARAKEDKETDFVAHARTWGKRITNTPLVEHNGSYYLECRFMNASKPTYLVDNIEADIAILKSFLPSSYSNAATQGLEKEVIIRDFKVENIKEIKVLGEHFQVI